MPTLRRFLSRRWLLAFLGACTLLFGLAMLHPYPRQSLFGPTIRSKPWCVWEDEVRRDSHRKKLKDTTTTKILRWFGCRFETMDRDELFNHAEMLPLLLALTDDPDLDIRECVLQVFISYNQFHDPSAIPVLRRRLGDDNACCRMKAASAIWLIDPSEPMLEVLMREIEDKNSHVRGSAVAHLAWWSERDPRLLPHLFQLASHQDAEIRIHTMVQVQANGDKALPVLFKGAVDPEVSVRRMAINSLSILNSRPKEAVPVLERSLRDEDKEVRDTAANAIKAIDPERYDRLKAEGKID